MRKTNTGSDEALVWRWQRKLVVVVEVEPSKKKKRKRGLAPELDDINLLAARLQNAVFSHISRSVNLRADSLAKGGRSRAQTFSDVNVMVLRRPALVASLIEPE
ncbi:hypothetical protein DY000_02037322 [Brassica cretica]|uniref:RNase H type-1 domain-containing protein n=1 Tax=Brassica cretica TaxID=69181 RepID=A0ABQ7BPK9_BRACR|nr:hypothetical protein DY000_02037322 [Brassica cretica]